MTIERGPRGGAYETTKGGHRRYRPELRLAIWAGREGAADPYADPASTPGPRDRLARVGRQNDMHRDPYKVFSVTEADVARVRRELPRGMPLWKRAQAHFAAKGLGHTHEAFSKWLGSSISEPAKAMNELLARAGIPWDVGPGEDPNEMRKGETGAEYMARMARTPLQAARTSERDVRADARRSIHALDGVSTNDLRRYARELYLVTQAVIPKGTMRLFRGMQDGPLDLRPISSWADEAHIAADFGDVKRMARVDTRRVLAVGPVLFGTRFTEDRSVEGGDAEGEYLVLNTTPTFRGKLADWGSSRKGPAPWTAKHAYGLR